MSAGEETKIKVRVSTNKEPEEAMTCGRCRHSNQGTCDFAEGLIFCKFQCGIRGKDTECDAPIRTSQGEYWLFEDYDGNNCTWLSETMYLEVE